MIANSFETLNISMQFNSSVFKRKVHPEIVASTSPRFQPRRIQSANVHPKIESKRIQQRAPSPGRSFTSSTNGLKPFESATKTTVGKTPTKILSKSLPRMQSKLSGNARGIVSTSTPITKISTAKNEIFPMEIKRAQNDDTNKIGKKYEINYNIDSFAISEAVAEETSVAEAMTRISLADDVNEENFQSQLQTSEEKRRNDIASEDGEDTKIKSTQSKWNDEVLKLLNTGSEMELSKQLATIGPKTATLIRRCREKRGDFGEINDLQIKLGWSDKVYKKFLLRNFL